MIDKHDRSNISHYKAFSGKVAGQYDLIEFLHHGLGSGLRHRLGPQHFRPG
jgi:hypothetical protein